MYWFCNTCTIRQYKTDPVSIFIFNLYNDGLIDLYAAT